MACLFAHVLDVYVIVLVIRAVLSWFPISPGSGLAPIVSVLYTLTEPVLAPLRRVIPPVGGFDLSFIVLFIAIQIVRSRIPCSGFGIL